MYSTYLDFCDRSPACMAFGILDLDLEKNVESRGIPNNKANTCIIFLFLKVSNTSKRRI